MAGNHSDVLPPKSAPLAEHDVDFKGETPASDHLLEEEPERYELREPPAYDFAPTRREFLRWTAAGLFVSAVVSPSQAQRGSTSETSLESRLHIDPTGTITVFSGKVEVGQGARTELAMAAAEELHARLEQVRVRLADTELTPNDGITAGSRTTPATVAAVRRAAAMARQWLVSQAAARWQVDPSEVTISEGWLISGQRKLAFGELAGRPEVGSQVQLTAASQWKVLGKPQARLDATAIVTGTHRYPSDIQRPNMLYGAVLRPPAYQSTLVDVDLAAASKIAGVQIVREGDFIGSVAPTSYAARQAIAAIAATAQWQQKPHPSSSQLPIYLKQHAPKAGTQPRENLRGDVQGALLKAAIKRRAEYFVPYIQHVPMEPRAAVAEWNDDKLTVWTGTQNPFGVRDQLAQALKIPPSRVRVIVPDTGGGFGGKHTGEVAIEAARLAREAGRPVSLRWSRKEEFEWAYFRPAGLFEIEAGLDEKGLLLAWDFCNYNAGLAALESPYRCPNSRTRFLASDSPLREGSYRGIAATANNFARECFLDELAQAARQDSVDFRLAHLENPRLKAVIEAAADSFGWAARKTTSGFAAGTEKGSFVAACAEVDLDSSPLRVVRISMAFECGAILNPSNLRAQVEGSLIQGLGAALTEEIEFEGGKLKNGNFQRYRVPRFRDVPPMQIILLDRKDLPPAGAGETPIIAVAPAIANAVSAATGKPVRRLPVSKS